MCALAQSVYSVMTAQVRGALCKYSIDVRLAGSIQLGEVDRSIGQKRGRLTRDTESRPKIARDAGSAGI